MSDASINSGTFSGSGAIADKDQRGRPAEKHGRRQRVALRLGDGVVKAAALADLPVHAGRLPVVDVQAIHPEVVAGASGMRRVDERERDERPAVLGPARHDRQPIEPDVRRDDVEHGSAGLLPRCRRAPARGRRRARPTAWRASAAGAFRRDGRAA